MLMPKKRVTLEDANGIHIEIDSEEFMIAFRVGLGLLATQARQHGTYDKSHKKTAQYIESLLAIAKKIRHTHLNIMVIEDDRPTTGSGESNQGDGIEATGIESQARVE